MTIAPLGRRRDESRKSDGIGSDEGNVESEDRCRFPSLLLLSYTPHTHTHTTHLTHIMVRRPRHRLPSATLTFSPPPFRCLTVRRRPRQSLQRAHRPRRERVWHLQCVLPLPVIILSELTFTRRCGKTEPTEHDGKKKDGSPDKRVSSEHGTSSFRLSAACEPLSPLPSPFFDSLVNPRLDH